MKKPGFWNGKLSWNKIGKDRFIILLICGLLLLVVVLPTDPFENKETSQITSAKKSSSQSQEKKQDTSLLEEENDFYNMNYSRYMEMRLEKTLSYVEGTGKVKVLVTVRQSETKVVEKDHPNVRKNRYETGKDGENTNTMELTNDTETVYTEDENGHKIPFVTAKIQPKIAGVLVVAQGAGNERVKKQITEVIQALFDVEAHKIIVVKMKGENQ